MEKKDQPSDWNDFEKAFNEHAKAGNDALGTALNTCIEFARKAFAERDAVAESLTETAGKLHWSRDKLDAAREEIARLDAELIKARTDTAIADRDQALVEREEREKARKEVVEGEAAINQLITVVRKQAAERVEAIAERDAARDAKEVMRKQWEEARAERDEAREALAKARADLDREIIKRAER